MSIQIPSSLATSLLAEREAAIEHFKKEKFYTVELDAQGIRASSGKFNSKTDAEKLRSACLGKTAVVQSVTRKDKTERPPGRQGQHRRSPPWE